jgi:hypothetical protein
MRERDAKALIRALAGAALAGWVTACGSDSGSVSYATAGSASGAPSGATSGATSGAMGGSGSGAISGAGAMSGIASGAASGIASGAASGAASGGTSGRPGDAGVDAATDATMGDESSDAPAGPAPGDNGGPCDDGGTCNGGLVCGDGGVCAPPPPYCDSRPKKPLPYDISADFNNVALIGPGMADFTIVSNPDCNATSFPAVPPPGGPAADGGDASTDSPSDSGDAGIADAVSDGAASDATAADGAESDADAGAATGDASPEASADGSAEAGPRPDCYEFLYNPSCNVTANCYTGAIFQNTPVSAGPATGSSPGICIGLGATAVTFWARASRDGTIVKFGSTKAAQCVAGRPTPAPNDPVAQQTLCPNQTEFFLAITTQWQQYTVSLPAGEPYDYESNVGGVWKAFSAVVEPTDYHDDAGAPLGTYILVKSITWVASVASGDAGSDVVSSDATDGSADAAASQ